MKLFDIQVFTSDREFDVTLRNLTIIRASQIIHRISVASAVLLRSIKRFLTPGKVVVAPHVKLRPFKALKQKANVAVNAKLLLSSRKRVPVSGGLQVKADSRLCSFKKMREGQTWRVTSEALLGAKKSGVGSIALAFDANLHMQKVRKRRLGEVSQVRLANMEPMTLDELDYIIEP